MISILGFQPNTRTVGLVQLTSISEHSVRLIQVEASLKHNLIVVLQEAYSRIHRVRGDIFGHFEAALKVVTVLALLTGGSFYDFSVEAFHTFSGGDVRTVWCVQTAILKQLGYHLHLHLGIQAEYPAAVLKGLTVRGFHRITFDGYFALADFYLAIEVLAWLMVMHQAGYEYFLTIAFDRG